MSELQQEIDENKMDIKGKRYFGLLIKDSLKLFIDEMSAALHLNDLSNIWENRPAIELHVYRNSKDGIFTID